MEEREPIDKPFLVIVLIAMAGLLALGYAIYP
jgi:hypothetical protein